jgi:uncharacterized protein (UPF0332 family)
MTLEQAALLQKTREALKAAEMLAQGGLNDFAAGRAYYAMFYAAQALLQTKGLTFSQHGSTLAAFGQHFVKTGEVEPQYHRFILDAFDARLLGDYSTTKHITPETAAEMIQQAKLFLELAERLLPPTTS